MHTIWSENHLPEVNSRSTLVSVGWSDATDAAFGKEDSDERRIVSTWPLFDGESQRVGVVFGRVRELQEAVHRDLLTKETVNNFTHSVVKVMLKYTK